MQTDKYAMKRISKRIEVFWKAGEIVRKKEVLWDNEIELRHPRREEAF